MNQIQITLHIDAAAAVRAGNTYCGEARLDITPEVLATLTPDERDTLQRHLARERYYVAPLGETLVTGGESILIGRADVATLQRLLNRRRAEVAQREAGERADSLERLRQGAQDVERTSWKEGHSFVLLDSACPHLNVEYLVNSNNAEVAAAARAYLEAEKRREAHNAGVRAEAEQRAAALAAKREVREEALAVRAESLKARLDPTFRDRWEAGYASEAEAAQRLWGVVLEDLDLDGYEACDTQPADTLSDEDWLRLRAAQKNLPKLPGDSRTWGARIGGSTASGCPVEGPLYLVLYLDEPAVRYALDGDVVAEHRGEFGRPLS